MVGLEVKYLNYYVMNGQWYSSEELYHHGIKGMKWGIRRYQNPDGSLTPAGDKRYSNDEKTTSEAVSSRKGFIQKRKDKLTEHYISKGYQADAAKTMAAQRMKTEAVLAVVGTVAVTAAGIAVSRRIGQDYFDHTFKLGKVIQNIGARENANFKDAPFFAAINNGDKKAYGALYPNEKREMARRAGSEYEGIYKNTIKLTDNVKRASVANARKIFYEQMDKDPQFKKNVLETLRRTSYSDRNAINDYVTKGKHSRKLYDRFNQALATPQFQAAGIHNRYYDALKKYGYNAILDINDTRYSGYKNISKSPTIFFGDNKWEKIGAKKLSDKEIDRNAQKFLSEYNVKQLCKALGAYSAAGVSFKAARDQAIVKRYLDEHPDSKLSRKEILENYS